MEGSDGTYGVIQGNIVMFSLTTFGDYKVVFKTTALHRARANARWCRVPTASFMVPRKGGGTRGFGLVPALDVGQFPNRERSALLIDATPFEGHQMVEECPLEPAREPQKGPVHLRRHIFLWRVARRPLSSPEVCKYLKGKDKMVALTGIERATCRLTTV
jgi:hypothetical protein